DGAQLPRQARSRSRQARRMSFHGFWLIGAIALAASWLIALPAGARGKNWHYVHAFVPLVVLAACAFAPASASGAAELFLACGGVVLVLATTAWAIGQALRNHSIMDIAYPIMVASVA